MNQVNVYTAAINSETGCGAQYHFLFDPKAEALVAAIDFDMQRLKNSPPDETEYPHESQFRKKKKRLNELGVLREIAILATNLPASSDRPANFAIAVAGVRIGMVQLHYCRAFQCESST